jgi:hypothetical protein
MSRFDARASRWQSVFATVIRVDRIVIRCGPEERQLKQFKVLCDYMP